jgi:hypothetical protein
MMARFPSYVGMTVCEACNTGVTESTRVLVEDNLGNSSYLCIPCADALREMLREEVLKQQRRRNSRRR